MINPSDISKVCSICVSKFHFFFLRKQICQSCYRAVCSKCSMQKRKNNDSNAESRICDSCYSNYIEQEISKAYSVTKERYKAEIFGLEKKYEYEKNNSEIEAVLIEDLQNEIEDHKQQFNYLEKELNDEYKALIDEVSRIEKDFVELNNRLECLIIDN